MKSFASFPALLALARGCEKERQLSEDVLSCQRYYVLLFYFTLFVSTIPYVDGGGAFINKFSVAIAEIIYLHEILKQRGITYYVRIYVVCNCVLVGI